MSLEPGGSVWRREQVGQGEQECLLEERCAEASFAGGEGSELPGRRRLFCLKLRSETRRGGDRVSS